MAIVEKQRVDEKGPEVFQKELQPEPQHDKRGDESMDLPTTSFHAEK